MIGRLTPAARQRSSIEKPSWPFSMNSSSASCSSCSRRTARGTRPCLYPLTLRGTGSVPLSILTMLQGVGYSPSLDLLRHVGYVPSPTRCNPTPRVWDKAIREGWGMREQSRHADDARHRGKLARGRVAAVLVLVAAVCVACAPSALANFPYFGDGTAGDPSSWKLAPGHVPTNIGGLGWKFAATPADPNVQKVPGEKVTIEQSNSQQDELCGVTGMSLVDSHATVPSGTGSCIAAGTPVKTGFEVSVGRPDVSIAELDSGIKWNDSGDMFQLRKKVLINAGELPAPKADLASTFDSSTGVDCSTAHAGTGGDFNPGGGDPGGVPGGSGPTPYDATGDGVFNTLDYACDSRVANVVQTYPRCTNPPTTSSCRNGPSGMLTPEDLIIAFSAGSDHHKNR